jgi:hypothetical protein
MVIKICVCIYQCILWKVYTLNYSLPICFVNKKISCQQSLNKSYVEERDTFCGACILIVI